MSGMASFGQDLRAEREGRSISLDALAAETKVQTRHLRALEEDDLGALPGGVFRRGIVRAYLAALGVEPEGWMTRFEQMLASTGQAPAVTEESWAEFAENVKRNRTPGTRTNQVRWLGVVALLLVVLAAAWAVWKYVLGGVRPG